MQTKMHTAMQTKAHMKVVMPTMAEAKMYTDMKVVMLTMVDELVVSSVETQTQMHTSM